MKLRNKKTGVVIETARSSAVTKDKFRIYDEYSDKYYTYNSLAELNAEWEDAPEEPKEHYFITEYGGVFSLNEYEGLNNVANIEDYKQIGNYFETEEEAEEAVEKLKAWKRLKDKGFVFKGVNEDDGSIKTALSKGVKICESVEFYDDMILLFGGEE